MFVSNILYIKDALDLLLPVQIHSATLCPTIYRGYHENAY